MGFPEKNGVALLVSLQEIKEHRTQMHTIGLEYCLPIVLAAQLQNAEKGLSYDLLKSLAETASRGGSQKQMTHGNVAGDTGSALSWLLLGELPCSLPFGPKQTQPSVNGVGPRSCLHHVESQNFFQQNVNHF
jgi:hypothetical protein